ncbi:MAG: hypothetical protein IJY86_04495, partial [Clostridia bacterium]|nr:hypothetical protein [Clostridia bacterium]
MITVIILAHHSVLSNIIKRYFLQAKVNLRLISVFPTLASGASIARGSPRTIGQKPKTTGFAPTAPAAAEETSSSAAGWDKFPRAPSAPLGHLPRKGEIYMGRLLNRPYRNYSLFISEAASLFNIH